jgi:hypothetical protein
MLDNVDVDLEACLVMKFRHLTHRPSHRMSCEKIRSDLRLEDEERSSTEGWELRI